MKILIATPLFPPDIGGPATYVFNLAQKLSQKGVEVLIIAYGKDSRLLWERTSQGFEKIIVPMSKGKGIRHLSFLWQVLQNGNTCDLIYIYDLWSAGLPSRLANLFLRKPLIVRLGGDSLWEAALEKGLTKSPLPDYYAQPKTDREYFVKVLQNFVLRGCCKIIFSSVFLRDIFSRYRPVVREKADTLENPQKIDWPNPAKNETSSNGERTLFFAGRLVKCKNLERLMNVFFELLKTQPSLCLRIAGEGPRSADLVELAFRLGLKERIHFLGPLDRGRLAEEIKKAYLCVLVSISDVSPNFALECLNLKKPLILTKHNGLSEGVKSKLVLIDPFNEADIASAIVRLLDPAEYQAYCQIIAALNLERSWDDVAGEHLKLFEAICQK